jgi:hypothetical protein
MQRSTLVDANLLVLLVVGDADPAFIEQHRRLGSVSKDDHVLLRDMLRRAPPMALVPHVLAETSNLLRQSAEPRRSLFVEGLGRLILRFGEVEVSSSTAVREPVYSRLGLTDAVLFRAARSGSTIVTVDLDLFVAAGKAGLSCVNFNHVRVASRA